MKGSQPKQYKPKKPTFFEAKVHIEIIRQVKGETAFIERQVEYIVNPTKNEFKR